MTSLSWALYAADLVEKIGIASLILAVISGATLLFIVMELDTTETSNTKLQKIGLSALAVAILCVFVAVFTPSKDAVHKIIVVEYGNAAIQTPEVQKPRQGINVKLEGEK